MNIKSYVITDGGRRLEIFNMVCEKAGLPKAEPFLWVHKVDVKNRSTRSTAVTLDHAEVLKKAKSENLDAVIIYEDDAFPCKDAGKKVEEIISKYKNDMDTSMVILGWMHETIYQLRDKHIPLRPIGVGSHAYVVFNRGFDNAIKVIEQTANVMNIDWSIRCVVGCTRSEENLFIQYNEAGDDSIHGEVGYNNNKKMPHGFIPAMDMQ